METRELKNGQIMTIREATKEDASNIVTYLNEVAGETDYLSFGKGEFSFSLEEEAEYIEEGVKNPGSIMLLSFIEDELASVSQLIGHTKKRELHTCELTISTRKKFWGLGIGTLIMEELIKHAKKNERLKLVYLEAVSENKRAINLYKKFGFIEAGEIPALMQVEGLYMDVTMMYLVL
ncbi:GNAT family N-acetyltransferase [Listeria innocua]|uniref:GNAT family N-acetyltransferase n=1 Tax=Listeria innocua TaxID=1642 RepID=UPI0005EDF0B4|nr:GNAT family protein [Listeria innocua]EAE6207496.1 N-acetyltransferase [Listeria innocua]EEP3926281.1 GNAT family N-acetyltransferase [Listeria innocua]EIX7075560.1 GNAT family N-acetyltransferase [Listeria innocua]EIX7078962.1 GNAT family N-acetyltransferase [Listeria innocua]EIX7082012.1 GNAT family N-acetyltransferase [Listeria innocua]